MIAYKAFTRSDPGESIAADEHISRVKNLSKIILSTVTAMGICLLLLVGSSCIPRSLIQKNSEKSAEYLSERAPFPILIGDYVNSMQDNYSDTVLCDILYCIDTSKPFSSTIEAKYAQGEMEEAYTGYLGAVKGEKEANREYGRYWHGSMVLLRPLMLLMPISGIRILFGAATICIQLLLVAVFLKKGKKAFALCYLLSFLMIHPWMLFTSLEYSTAFLTASLASLFVLKKSGRNELWTYRFFVVVGVVTCFVDFLTTETLTFTLPMLLLLSEGNGDRVLERNRKRNPCLMEKTGKKHKSSDGIKLDKNISYVVKSGICWILGYLGMFMFKMLLLFMVAGKEVMLSSITEGLHRVSGEVHSANISIAPSVSIGSRLSGAIWHNLACFYPTKSGLMESGPVWLLTVFILTIAFSAVYLLHDRIEWGGFLPMMVLAAVPYLRFLVLSNHAYEHFFITYRAQMVTVTVFTYFVYENGIKQLIKMGKRGK